MAVERVILAAIVACSLVSMASAIAGTATYYGPPITPSSCYGYEDRGTLVAAANPGLFNNRAACGNRYSVTCTGPTGCRGGSVTVTIVDLCPGCGPNQIDLSRDAFSTIANLDVGRINIDYVRV